MTTAAKTAFGTELWLAPSGNTLVKVAELLTVTPPTITRDTEDATTHDSADGAMEFITDDTYDPGEIPFQTHYIAGSAGDDALLTASTGGALQDFKVVVKAASGTEDIEGSGYVTGYGPDELPVKGKQAASGTIKVSGAAAQAASA